MAYRFHETYMTQQNVLTFCCEVGDNVKKVPFHFTVKLPKPLKERVVVERDDKGRIVHSKVPDRKD